MSFIKDFIYEHKKIVIIIASLVMVTALCFTGYIKYKESNLEEITYSELMELVDSGTIEKVTYSPDEDSMRVFLTDGSEKKTTYPAYEEFKKDMLSSDININMKKSISMEVLMICAEIVFMFSFTFIFRLSIEKMGDLKSKDLLQKSNVKFDQIIGLDEIIDDISLYVSMIKNPHIGEDIGARLPKGLLLAGEPGTGKTLIAKAIAGEAGVPFISVSGSEFAEMFKGVGAKRVRKIFKVAKENSPCVIFIDEIDAIGGKRTSRKADSEDIQIINQLLKEMDGFKQLSGVFVLAATNCPDNLDEALTRAGRFDRKVTIMPPKDWKVRQQLLDLYLKKYSVDIDVDTERIARAIAGFTGADISMICNEASLVAVSKGLKAINLDCINEAIDKKIFSGNRSKKEQYVKDREIIAYHEAGHAVMKHLLGQKITRASIIGTTSGVGGAVFGEEKDSFFKTSKDFRDNILVCYGGRVSEKIKYNDISTGSSNDIYKATEMIVQYVSNYGFDENTGPVNVKILYDLDMRIDDMAGKITEIAKSLENEAEKLLRNNYSLVERLVEELLDKSMLNGDEIDALLSR